MLKKFIFLALLSIFPLSACGGSDSVSDDCDDQDEECLNYDDDDEGGLSSGLEKVMTIGGFIIGAIIICILIYFIGRAAGLFRSSRGSEQASSSTAPPHTSRMRGSTSA